jgi:biotin/methionine sulfoxide reductase
MPEFRPHLAHWGAFEAEVDDGRMIGVRPHRDDRDPSPLLDNIVGSVRHPTRIERPAVRAGWLEGGAGPSSGRGSEPFVELSWDEALDLLAGELRRVRDAHGPASIYGGSYGWASAGRFHHAQSQVHRFLALLGGYTSSVNTYSTGAASVILPHVLGDVDVFRKATTWQSIVRHTELLVCFGGVPPRTARIMPGGGTRRVTNESLRKAADHGLELVLFSPLRDDVPASVECTWHPLVPGTDSAVMLGLAHVLLTEALHDPAFLARYCVGFERFERYLLGADDGQPKSPEWAEELSGVPADRLRSLARRMAARRTLVNVSWSLQRIEHGEQAPWMGVTLASMLGQIGLPGGGFGMGYGSMAEVGAPRLTVGLPRFGRARNPVSSFIPVARISDMLLHPGDSFEYNGQRLTYPDIRLVYWCGGNPFHHHQDLARLRRALARVETVVVHDSFWTATARRADIVLPATMSLERDDIGGAPNDPCLVAMHRAIAPHGEARDDYEIFAALARRLEIEEAFTEGRSQSEWIMHMYETWRREVAAAGVTVPPFEEFWRLGHLELSALDDAIVMLADFRANPDDAPLSTPSGRIEIFSRTIHGFGYDDCPGHPAWLEPDEWLASPTARRFPLLLIANQPSTRLHSQLDVGAASERSKVQRREPVRLNPADAASRGVADGDVVRIFNDRGSCLAGAVLSDLVRPGVIQLATGAWYDPRDPADPDSMCVHGNPNVLTRDKGTSRLAQGCTGQHSLVQLERWAEPVPPIRVHAPPDLQRRP